MRSNENEALLNTAQVAELLNIKAATLEKSRCNGTGDYPLFIRFGRTVRYLRKDVDAWILAHRVNLAEGMA